MCCCQIFSNRVVGRMRLLRRGGLQGGQGVRQFGKGPQIPFYACHQNNAALPAPVAHPPPPLSALRINPPRTTRLPAANGYVPAILGAVVAVGPTVRG